MPALLLYAVVSAMLIALTRRWIVALTWRTGALLALLPLAITGPALLTGGIYAPIDLAYENEPLASVAREHGIAGTVNPLLTDVQRLMIPWQKAVRYALAHGDWPLWNPFSYSGDILAAASEPSPWHPLHLLGYLLPLAQSVTFHATAVLFAAALCAYALARDLGASEPASVIAGAAWMLSAFLLFFAQVPLGSTVLLQPMIFVAVRKIVRDPRYATIVLLAIVLTLAVVAGHPESTLHVVAWGVVYGVFEFASHRNWRGVAAAIAAGILALALSAIHLLPFIDALPQTSDYQYRAAVKTGKQSVPARDAAERLLANAVPFVFGSPAAEDAHIPPAWREPVYGYAGSLLFAPALFALFRWRDRMKWFLLAMLIVGALAGVSAPGITEAIASLPLFDIALNQRLVYGAVLALAILAAMGVDIWMRERSEALAVTTIGVFVAVAGLIAILWLPMQSDGLSEPWLRANAARELIPLALCAALFLQRPSARFGAAAFLVLLVVQRMPADHERTPTYPANALYPRTPLIDALPKNGQPYRVVGRSSALVPNTSAHYELEDPRGFHGMTFARLKPTLELWSRLEPVSFNAAHDLNSPFLSFLNVRYAIDRVTDALPAGWRVVTTHGSGRLLENPTALERAFVPRQVSLAPDSSAIMLATTDDFSSHARILAPTPRAPFDNGRGTIETRRDGTGLHLAATMESDGWVVISETAWDGWRATIDGRDAPLHIANDAFLALQIPAGRHDVRLRYLPRSFVIGATITALTIATMLLVSERRRLAGWLGAVLGARRRDAARPAAGTAALLLFALPTFASFPAKRLFIPAAGRVSTSIGEVTTNLWITNTSSKSATARIALLESGKSTPKPQFEQVTIAPHTTAHFDNVTETLLRRPGVLGALLIESDQPVVATAQIASGGRGGSLAGIPIELAVGRGDSAVLHGADARDGRFRYNIHLVETNRSGTVVELTVRDDQGREAGRKEILLRELEAATLPITDVAANVPTRATVELRIARGAGRVIAAGSQIAVDTGDTTTFEMTFPRRQRTEVPRREAAAWIAAAVVLALSALVRFRRRSA